MCRFFDKLCESSLKFSSCRVFSTLLSLQLVSCQTPPDLSEIDAEAIIACVQVGIEAIPDQSEAGNVSCAEICGTYVQVTQIFFSYPLGY